MSTRQPKTLPDMQDAKQQVLSILHGRYPGYAQMKRGDRVLFAMSVLANDIKVREVGGNNHGPWVDAILGATGLGTGFAWCAAAIEFCCQVAGTTLGPTKGAAAVANWRAWASQNRRIGIIPARGRLATRLNQDGLTGHMGIVAEVRADGSLRTYEGNTMPGTEGDQRDGGGLYERIRPAGYFTKFIDLN